MLDRPVPPLLEQLVFDGLLVKSPERRLQTIAEILPVLDALLAASRPAPEAGGPGAPAPARSGPLVTPTWPLEPVPVPVPVIEDVISLGGDLDAPA